MTAGFAAHGEFKARLDGRIIVSEVVGPWNREAVLNWVGHAHALSDGQKRGAVLFFGRAGCVGCHQVGGASNELFSDFREHVIGVPQVAPDHSNMVFDGPSANEDFGREQVTGDAADGDAEGEAPPAA